MPKSGLLERQKNAVYTNKQATKETYIQFMADMFMLALNDPEVMGKDVLGSKRMARVVKAAGENYDKYHGALEAKNDETEALRVMLDDRLRRFAGDELVPFKERYEWAAPERPMEPKKLHEQKIHQKAKKRKK